jgi:hypothetical protein
VSCAISEIQELNCCPSEPENPCIICPNGATVGDDFVPNASINESDDAALTCGDLIYYAKQLETESYYW